MRYLAIFLVFFSLLEAQETQVQPNPKICLTMVVQNNAKTIECCIESLAGLVDCFSICDVGSTDETVEIIERVMKKNHISGRVHHHDWKNAGDNRTRSALAAVEVLKELGFSLDQSYLLFLDPNMVVHVDSQFQKLDLTKDCYSIVRKNNEISNINFHLGRASIPWKCTGSIYEYWDVPSSCEILSSITINDHKEGQNDWERDIQLLSDALKEEPNNPRYEFYLAQCYFNKKNYEEAIRWYQKRIAHEDQQEEVWVSRYMLGQCYDCQNHWDQAMFWYIEAYHSDHSRAEPLLKMANHYRCAGDQNLAYLFAKMGSKIPYPLHAHLSISDSAYQYQFDEELSVVAYYVGRADEGYAALNNLLLKKCVPSHLKDNALSNLRYYIQKLTTATYRPISFETPPIRSGDQQRYILTNASIQKTEQGYDLICRSVNYILHDGMQYKVLDPVDPTIRSKNFFVRYDREFNLMSSNEIVDKLPHERKKVLVEGMEDCRLVKIDGADWCIGASWDHPTNNPLGQVLSKLGPKSPDGSFEVDRWIPLRGIDPNRTEKNWLPFAFGSDLFAINSFAPFIVVQIDRETGVCKEVAHQETGEYDCSQFQGSAGPIEFDDGYLVLIREQSKFDHRYCTHRLLYLDKNFRILNISKPFLFSHEGMECCCGMTLNHEKNQCIFCLNVEDFDSLLCFLNVQEIRSMVSR